MVIDGDVGVALRYPKPPRKHEISSWLKDHGNLNKTSVLTLNIKSLLISVTMTNRPSPTQLEALVEFLEQNPGIAKGLLRTTQAKVETKRKWASLANNLNSLGGAIKDGQGWAKYWAEKKCALKKQCAIHSASMRRTGGGMENLQTFSAIENRLVAVMGGQGFATGDSSLTVNPFPTSLVSPVLEEIIEDTEMTPVYVTPLPGPSHNETIPEPSTIPVSTPLLPTAPPRQRRRTSIQRPQDVNMERFTSIEERRVEAELLTARAFAQLTEQMGNIASALTSMATAITEIARKMPDP